MALERSNGTMWEKPAHVEIEGGYLVAEFGSRTYPVDDAIKRARALQRLTRIETEEDARQFTADWGFFCRGWGNEKKAVFPVQLFFLVRNRLVALARLASACHEGRRSDVIEAKSEVGRAVEQLHDYYFYVCRTGPFYIIAADGPATPDPVSPEHVEHRRQLLRPDLFTEPASGDYWMTELARIWSADLVADSDMSRLPRPAGAAPWETLAAELSVHTELQAVKHGREWRLEERPPAFNLEVAIVWSIRSMQGVLHYRSCKSCQEPILASRRDKRYCHPDCGSRERVRNWRRKSQDRTQRDESGTTAKHGRKGRRRRGLGR